MTFAFLNNTLALATYGGPRAWLMDVGGDERAFLVTQELWASMDGVTGDMTITAQVLTPTYAFASYALTDPDTLLDVPATADYYQVASAAGRGDGGYVVIINHEADPISDATVQFYSASGTVEATFALTGSSTQAAFGTSIVRLDDGRFLLSYSQFNLLPGDIVDANVYGQLLDADGAAAGAAFQINADATDANGGGETVQLGAGLVAVFDHGVVTQNNRQISQLRARMIDAAGQPTGADIVIASAGAGMVSMDPDVHSLATGGFIVVWQEESADPPSYPPPAGFAINWAARYAIVSPAGAVLTSGTLASGAWTYDGAAWSGTQLFELTSCDLANGGAAAALTIHSSGQGVSSSLYTFDRAGLVATDTGIQPLFNADMELASDGEVLVSMPGGTGPQFFHIVDPGVVGGAAADTLYGDRNVDDRLDGAGGADRLFGLSGHDWLRGGAGDDLIDGGAGLDVADYSNATSAVTVSLATAAAQVTGGAGRDTLVSIEALIGSAFADRLTGNAGANEIDGGAGRDTMIGGDGDDAYAVDLATDVVTELANQGTDTVMATATWRMSAHIENLVLMGVAAIGGVGNDLANDIRGNDGANALSGLGGADTIHGGLGADNLDGGAGDDFLYGEGDNDGFRAGAGADLFDGGDGVDAVNYATGTSTVVYLDGSGVNAASAAGDTLVGIENLVGSATGVDVFVGDANANRLVGNGGNDRLTGRGGADILEGGAGNDRLVGEDGADVMTGGADADTFVFNLAPAAGGLDRITDFEAGVDKLEIDASQFGGGLIVGGAVNFVSGPTPTSVGFAAGVFLYDTDDGFLYWDADGAGAGARLAIVRLQNLPALAASDFTVVA
ncbi:MAG: calcium-binding protein [Rhizobiales bacterium]|nr:calcium-binding protein [Hyphomicrobiales bacterium]